MNRRVFLIGLFALVIAVAWAAGAAAQRNAGSVALSPGSSHDIMFDGYCDGLHIEIDNEGCINGYQIGMGDCVEGDILGTLAHRFNRAFLAINYTCDATFGCELSGFGCIHTVLRGDRTWTHYCHEVTGMEVINSGTWSVKPPLRNPMAIRETLPISTQRR